MKIAVTYENGRIFQHFGHTEEFKIYETDNGEIISAEVISTDGQGHSALADFLFNNNISSVICGGIGGGGADHICFAAVEIDAACHGLVVDHGEALQVKEHVKSLPRQKKFDIDPGTM